MRRFYAYLLIWMLSWPAFSWDRQAHQWIAQIAWSYLTPQAKQAVAKTLAPETMVSVSDWADRIRYQHRFSSWHYVSMPSAQSIPKPPGHLLHGIQRSLKALDGQDTIDPKTGLRLLIHLIGDLHQPLHVGNGSDHGGNDCYVQWFKRKRPISLHRIWDHFLVANIKGTQPDFLENSQHLSKTLRQQWQQGSLRDWAQESRALHSMAYPKGLLACTGKPAMLKKSMPKLGARYVNANTPIVKKRIRQAGVRLAHLLNQHYHCGLGKTNKKNSGVK